MEIIKARGGTPYNGLYGEGFTDRGTFSTKNGISKGKGLGSGAKSPRIKLF